MNSVNLWFVLRGWLITIRRISCTSYLGVHPPQVLQKQVPCSVRRQLVDWRLGREGLGAGGMDAFTHCQGETLATDDDAPGRRGGSGSAPVSVVPTKLVPLPSFRLVGEALTGRQLFLLSKAWSRGMLSGWTEYGASGEACFARPFSFSCDQAQHDLTSAQPEGKPNPFFPSRRPG